MRLAFLNPFLPRATRRSLCALLAFVNFAALGTLGTLGTLAPLGTQALAQAWPAKPIRIILQFPPGGSTDVVARILGEAMSQSLGQPVLVENKPGADGAIAGDAVARAAPDGYTFFLATNTAMAQVPLLKKTPPYDPVKSFTPVSLVGRYIYYLVVTPALPVKDVSELMAYGKANPGKLNYASYSGVTQLMHARIKAAGVEMNLVPYKGEGPTITDILGNHVQLTFATPISTLGPVKEGKLRALATLLPQRSALLPNLPTAVEAGLPPFPVGDVGSALWPGAPAARHHAKDERGSERGDAAP